MAEILVFCGEHWMDKLTALERQARGITAWKYAGRWQKGMVVEIREDGFWGDGPYPRKDKFRVVKAPGKAAEYRYLLADGADGSLPDKTKPETCLRRKYKVDSGDGKEVEIITKQKDLITSDCVVGVTL